MRRRPSRKRAADPQSSALLFAALGDTTRLLIVHRLCTRGPTSIVALTADSHVTRQAISKHLRVMEEAGVVRSTRQGRESIWELSPGRLQEARRYLDLISSQWDDALIRLRGLVES